MRTYSFADRLLQRRRLIFGLPALACGLVVPTVQARAGVHRSARVLMGTRVDLTLQGDDASILDGAAAAAFSEMQRLADMMSRYRSNSALNAINLAAGLQPVAAPPELMQVLLMARRASQTSGGAFDITVGALRAWDFAPDHPTVPSSQQVCEQLRWVNPQGLMLDEQAGTAYLTQRGMRLDLGGIAKLPILQAGMRQLLSHGITNAMINGGGDVLVNGQLDGRAWRIGLRDPRQPDRLLGVVALSHGFVAASGDYERFVMHQGRRLHHILDPRTGWPTQGPHGVALISDQLDAINGLGAAIMVAGTAAGRARVAQTPGLDALIVDADNSLWLSPGMAARLQRA
jgi:thiamine biosynthesis lipoprotein